jgi:5-bromo-4-chloroindolyl phosphate hydrolysis protein
MGSSFWVIVGIITVFAIITDGVVKIIKASKSGGGKDANKKFGDLEADLATFEQDLDDARQRIEVLEKIVTDEKYDLGKKIDDLAR